MKMLKLMSDFGYTKILFISMIILTFFFLIPAISVAEERKKIVVPRGGGESEFRRHCITCHKWDGRGGYSEGGMAADLRVTPLPIEALAYIIKNGRIERGMPAFAGTIGDNRIHEMAVFIKTKLRLKKEGEPQD